MASDELSGHGPGSRIIQVNRLSSIAATRRPPHYHPPGAMNQETANAPLQSQIESLLARAARRYIASRRERIPAFCSRHFSLKGAFRLHRQALGHDLWKAPANALWAVPYFVAQGAGIIAGKLGHGKTSLWLKTLPPGFETAVAREVEWLIYTELLELPIRQGERHSEHDALLGTLMADEAIARLLLPDLLALDAYAHQGTAREKLEQFFATYTGSRVAAADLTGSLLSLAAGAATLKQFTPGAMALGSATAAILAQELAITQFALGPALGSLYYGLFPATASTGLVVASISGAMAALGILSAISGMVTDPLQEVLGLHQNRLQRLLDAIESQLTGSGGDFRLRDIYVARVLDLVGLLRAAMQALK